MTGFGSSSDQVEPVFSVSAQETTGASFDLLRDFWFAARDLDIRGVKPESLDPVHIDQTVRGPMDHAFAEVDYALFSWEMDAMRREIEMLIGDDEFCVTLDHGVYFPNASFHLDLTRTVSDVGHTGSQYFRRRPRHRGNSLEEQLLDLRRNLRRQRVGKIVLADDGISTGKMLRTVSEACRRVSIRIDRMVVCCNKTEVSDFDGIAISSVVPHHPDRPWLNERDLYWGFPRAGLPLAPENGQDLVYALPFSWNSRLIQQRIGIEDRVDEFRRACLHANRALWLEFERLAGDELVCESCPPLRFVPEVLGKVAVRVVDLLDDLIAGNDLDLEDTVSRPVTRSR